jgi:hypothetical protein
MEDNNQKQSSAGDINKIQNIKTYSSDMAEAVRQNQGSVIKIALAEQNKREQENINKRASVTNKSKVFLVIGGVILIIGAIAGSYYLLQKNNTTNVQTPKTTVESIISSDINSFISTDKATNKTDLINLLDSEKSKQEKSGSIKSIFLTKQKDGQTALLPFNEFLSLADFTAPNALIRSLSDSYMIGIYTQNDSIADASSDSNKNKSNLFFIFKTKDYNNTYAGMLTWEKTMLDDMFPIFHIDVSGDNSQIFEKSFQDIIIENKDARVLYDTKGNPILFYLFTDKNNLVISDNEEAIKEVIARLITQNAKPL